jgi:O-antigen/teichoic acid export membrane protein
MIASFVLVYVLSMRYIKIRLRFEFSYWKKFLKESYPLGIAAVITFVYFKMDTILLSILRSSSDVGIYNAAYKVIENVSFFPSMIVGLVFPIIAQNVFSNRERFKEISDKTFKVFVLVVVPLVIGTMFLADGIVKLIGGSLFVDSAWVLRILVFALAFIFFSSFFNAILIAGNHQKKLMKVLFIAAIINVGANLIFIPMYSYYAAAAISVLTELFAAIVAFWIVAKELKYFPTLEKVGGIVSSGLIMAIFMFSFQRLNFILLAVSGVLIYAFSLWIFKAVRTEEITSIIRKKGVEEYEPVS